MTLYELRHYQTFPHNREWLHERFAEHTVPIFERLGLESLGFFEVSAGSAEGDLIYLMRWESHIAREDGWARFAADDEWREARTSTNSQHGPLVARTHSILMRPTRYSRLV